MKTETTRKLVNLLFIFCLCLPPVIGMTERTMVALYVIADAFDGLPRRA